MFHFTTLINRHAKLQIAFLFSNIHNTSNNKSLLLLLDAGADAKSGGGFSLGGLGFGGSAKVDTPEVDTGAKSSGGFSLGGGLGGSADAEVPSVDTDAKSGGGFSLGFGGSSKVDTPEVDVGADLSAGKLSFSYKFMKLRSSWDSFQAMLNEPIKSCPHISFLPHEQYEKLNIYFLY